MRDITGFKQALDDMRAMAWAFKPSLKFDISEIWGQSAYGATMDYTGNQVNMRLLILMAAEKDWEQVCLLNVSGGKAVDGNATSCVDWPTRKRHEMFYGVKTLNEFLYDTQQLQPPDFAITLEGTKPNEVCLYAFVRDNRQLMIFLWVPFAEHRQVCALEVQDVGFASPTMVTMDTRVPRRSLAHAVKDGKIIIGGIEVTEAPILIMLQK